MRVSVWHSVSERACAGFPSRRLYEDFVEHFWHLAPDLLKLDLEDPGIARRIIEKHLTDGFQYGRTKVFLKGGQMAVLDRHRTETLNRSAVVIQAYVRGHQQGGHYRLSLIHI